MKNRSKKILAVLASAIMTIALALPVHAANDLTTGGDNGGSLNMSKTITMNQQGVAVNEEYVFTMTASGMTDVPASVTQQPAPATASFTLGGASWAGAAETTSDTNYVKTVTGTWNPQITFTEAGIYKYTVTETRGSSTGVTYDQSEYEVTYTVIKDLDTDPSGNTLKIQSTSVVPVKDQAGGGIEEGEKTETVAFNNTIATADLRVNKTVSGNLGDTDKEFTFTLQVDDGNAANNTYNYIVYTSSNTQKTTGTVTENSTAPEVKLKSGEYVVIQHLPVGATYTVQEDASTCSDYTTTITNKGSQGSEITGDAERTATGSITAGDNIVGFENNKTAAVDAGIGLNVLPFVAVVVIAAALLSVFLFRKKGNN